MQKMHQIRRIITVAQLHVFRRVLLDVRGIVRVLEVFVQLLGLKLVLKLYYIYAVTSQMLIVAPMITEELTKTEESFIIQRIKDKVKLLFVISVMCVKRESSKCINVCLGFLF